MFYQPKFYMIKLYFLEIKESLHFTKFILKKVYPVKDVWDSLA